MVLEKKEKSNDYVQDESQQFHPILCHLKWKWIISSIQAP